MKPSTNSQLFHAAKSAVLLGLFVLVPLFFLPTTQEFFVTNKMYLLGFGALVLLLISTLELMFSKRFTWKKVGFDNAVLLFLFAVGLSTLFGSPNKVQALLNPNFGLVALLGLTIFYFYAARSREAFRTIRPLAILNVSALILSVIAIIFFFQPFKAVTFPTYLQFLQNPSFTPVGNQLDLIIFLGFFLVVNIASLTKRSHDHVKPSLLPFVVIGLTSLAILLTIYSSVQAGGQNSILATLPPFSISWYAAVETLKQPMTALFGAGVDNFASLFAQAKDVAYNTSDLWQINSFSISRSAFLHILTETGLVGLIAFGLLMAALVSEVRRDRHVAGNTPLYVATGYLLLVFLLLPISLISLFLLFALIVAVVQHRAHAAHTAETAHYHETHQSTVNLEGLLPVYLGLVMLGLAFVGITGFLMGRAYAAEVAFKKGLNGIVNNNLKELYDNQREAVLMNHHIERYRINFAQTNLLIANNIAAKAAPATEGAEPQELSEQDRQTIAQAIQAAISEAKAAVALNPEKPANWENLAVIYRNLLNVAEGADVWTISSYQRAIVLDPQNPLYRLNLGGVYFSLNNFDEASKLFEQAAALKSDWPNAHYNLAWASYQKKDFPRAVSEMQAVLSLLDPKADEADFKRATQELEEFKKQLPQADAEATGSAEEPQQLGLPTPPAATVSPRIQLPADASPESQ